MVGSVTTIVAHDRPFRGGRASGRGTAAHPCHGPAL